MSQINVKINGNDYQFDEAYTIIQACEIIGVEIPRFCYHKRLKIAGNCRMCLVEVVGAPKPVASCAINITNNMIINTLGEKVEAMRKGVMEFLLINHPLDCPICDQGGECDLQDQAFKYGRGYSSFEEDKRAVEEKNFGPLIKTNMTRCIQCMRCVRFIRDIAGVNELGTINRGEDLEIINAVKGSVRSEVSGNIIDLCPVGALTNKPYAYTARPWELKHIPSIDLADGMGSNIFLDVKGSEVMRILPRENDFVNEEWISDRTRFQYDGLRYQRLGEPYLRDSKDGRLKMITWSEAFQVLKDKLKLANPKKIAAIAGQTADFESIFLLKKIFEELGSDNLDFRQDGSWLPIEHKEICYFNSTFDGLEDCDFVLFIGCDIRNSAPVLNLRINRLKQENCLKTAMIGHEYNFNYENIYLGDECEILEEIFNEKNKICEILKSSKKPMIILGEDVLRSRDLRDYAFYWSLKISEKFGFIQYEGERLIWNGFNFLGSNAQRGSVLLAEFMPKDRSRNVLNEIYSGEHLEVLFLLNADELRFSEINVDFVIYQGHHGDEGARNADLILPGMVFSEKDAFYVNIEGRVQKAFKAVSIPPSNSKKDLQILLELYNSISNQKEFFDDESFYEFLEKLIPNFKSENIGEILEQKIDYQNLISKLQKPEKFHGKILKKIRSEKWNHFKTNSILRNSPLMNECSKMSDKIFG